MKFYKKKYLEISFENFVERFDISKNNYIKWSSLAFFLINNFDLLVDNKNGFQIIISKLKLQQLLQQICLIFSNSLVLANTHQVTTLLPILLKLVYNIAVI